MTKRVRYPIPKTLPRLRRLLVRAGYHVRLSVSRDDGEPLNDLDRQNIRALLEAYGAGSSSDELPEGTPRPTPPHLVKT